MKLFVAGSINQDILLNLERQPLVGETLSAENVSYAPGGKGANQAVAATRAGAEIIFLGAVGDDGFGKSLLAGLDAENILTSGVSKIVGVTTGLAVVSVVKGDNSIILHSGANAEFSPADIEREMSDEKNKLSEGDFILAQLETPQTTTQALFELGKAVGATCILNPAPAVPLDEKLIEATDYLIVNEIELDMIFTQISNASRKMANTQKLLEIQNHFTLQGVICTLGHAGVIACHGKEVYELAAITVEKIVDTTGAGDCFVGFFTAMLMQGEDFLSAIEYANIAASISIQALGAQTSMPTKAEVFSASQ